MVYEYIYILYLLHNSNIGLNVDTTFPAVCFTKFPIVNFFFITTLPKIRIENL